MSEQPHQRSGRDEAALERAFSLARNHEPAASPASRALIDRVVATAVAEKASTLAAGAHDTRVVPLRRAAAKPQGTSTTRSPLKRRSTYEVAALLAASLVAGIYVGGLSDSLPAAQYVASAIGLQVDGGEVFQALAGDETTSDLLEDSL